METTEVLKVNSKIKKSSIRLGINIFLFYIFIFNVIFIPNDTFNLKIISLFLLFIINLDCLINNKSHDCRIIIRFGFILTSFAILWSIILTGNIIENIKIGYPGYILLLYPIIKKYKINFGRCFILILKIMAYFIVIMAMLDFLHILDLNTNPILIWLHNSSNAMIGKGSHLPIFYMIFLKTSPLMFVALMYCLKHKEYFTSLVISIAIALSGTRANILMLISALIIYACFMHKNKNVRYSSIIFILLMLFILVIDGRVIKFFVDMFAKKASGDETRDGHLMGILETWKNSPLKFIFGSGFSSKFYSYGIKDYTSNIELSYWNLLRQEGIIIFGFSLAMYLYPAVKLIKNKRELSQVFAYFIYLIIAYTNPFLYSSTGVTLLLYMYWLCFGKSNFENISKKRS